MKEEEEEKSVNNNNNNHKKKKNKKKQKAPEEEKAKSGNETEENKNNIIKETNGTEKKAAKEKEKEMEINNKKRKRKEVFPFGNYRTYYGYRIGQGTEEDPRLKVFKKEWFEGKDCLDIGCNSGIITIQIAKKFHCRKILGIDIDSDRITDAYWHLRKFARVKKNHTNSSKMEITENVNGSEQRAASLKIETMGISMDDLQYEGSDLFDIVSFKKENFVQSWYRLEEQYDTIICLSVTKWIHLNWGDDGLITLFSKIWRLLRPGGILVLEPQPWRSYENNYRVSETTAMNFHKIIFHPKCFHEILLDKIGFRKAEDLSSALSDSKAGFDRPIYAFHK